MALMTKKNIDTQVQNQSDWNTYAYRYVIDKN
jgi:hypothetical protein